MKTKVGVPKPWENITKEDMDLLPEENGETLKSVRSKMPPVDVTKDGSIIVENSSGNRFEISGKGLTRRIKRLFTKEEVDEINNNLPRA